MAEITLYQHPNLQGENITFHGTDSDLSNNDFPGLLGPDWDGRVSSFRIGSGTWRLYEEPGHKGDHTPDLSTPGNYNVEPNFGAYGIEDNEIRSLLLV